MTSDMSAQLPSLADKAEAMLEKMETQHDTGVKELTTTDVVLAEKQQVQPEVVEQPKQVETPVLTDDYEVTIKVDGKEQTVKFGELKNGYSRESTFTQRMQNLGNQRRQLEEYFAQQQAQLIQAAQAIQLAEQRLQQYGPQQPKQEAPKLNPNEVATIGEIQQAYKALAEQFQQVRQQDQQTFQQALVQQQEAIKQELEVRRDQERFSASVSEFLASEDGRLLSELNPQAEAIIRYETIKTQPQDTEEAIKNMQIIAKEWAQRVKGKVQTQTVKTEVQKAKTVMEPPSGVPAQTISQPKPTVFKKDGGIDYQALFQRSLSLME